MQHDHKRDTFFKILQVLPMLLGMLPIRFCCSSKGRINCLYGHWACNAGRYRQQNVLISGATSTPPDYTLLNDKMTQLVDWYNSEAHKLHPIERAAKVHADFVGIHPFIDGNGRTSRLLMNLELLKAGYPPCVITVENRLAYYEALDQWMAYGKTEAFIQLVSDAVIEGFKPYQVILNLN